MREIIHLIFMELLGNGNMKCENCGKETGVIYETEGVFDHRKRETVWAICEVCHGKIQKKVPTVQKEAS